jgi:CHAT domain-containing protein
VAVVTRSHILVAAVFALTASVSVSGATAADLGRNLAGETCQSAGPLSADQATAFTCGGATDAVGAVAYVPAPPDPAAQHDALEKVVRSQSENLNCADPQWMGSGAFALRICTLKSNGWARIVLGVNAGGRLYRAEGPPSALPVLETAIASDAHVTLASGDTVGALAALQAKLPAGVIHAPTSDYASYKQFIETARLAGASDYYGQAEANYRQALAIEERLFGESSMVVGQTLVELALQVSNQGRFGEAAALFRRASPIIEASSDNNAHARLDSYLALDAANQRHYADALTFARQATAARRAEIAAASEANAQAGEAAATVPVSQGELAHALRIEAEMALRLNDLGTAKAAAEEALWIVTDEPGLPLWWRADTIALVGEINERQGRVVEAEHDLRDARDLNVKLFGDTAPTALADLKLGGFYARQQVYAPSLDAFRAAFAIAATSPTARAEVAPDDVVLFAKAEMAAGDAATRDGEVLRASQLVNSGVADQTIARVAARQAAGNGALSDLIAQAQAAERSRDLARVQLAAEYAKPDDERSRDREETLEAGVKLASAHADDMLAKVRQGFPKYASLADPGAADLGAVQAMLAPDEALVSFVFGQNASYALVVRQHSLNAVELAIGADELVADVSDLRRAFVPALGLAHLPEFSLKTSYSLYQSLMAPLQGHLDGVDHLIVVPGAELSNLPLAMLVTEPPTERDYQHAAWLVRRYALSEVPSAGAFLELANESEHHSPAPRPFLGLGAPAFSGPGGTAGAKALADLTASCREAGPVSADLLRALPPLPGSAHEVQTVGARIGGGNADILLGAQATEANFRAQPLDQFAVVYFATHGILPGEIHCEGEPALALSPPSGPATSPATDGMLQASEIAELKLNADLVVLSACNTAESTDGEGGGALQGLSDSFFAAGARAVLASHWEVPSNATESLMIGVFDPARRSQGLAQGLRQSQLALIGNSATAHPYYWAAFTIIGDGEGGAAYARSAQLATAGHP